MRKIIIIVSILLLVQHSSYSQAASSHKIKTYSDIQKLGLVPVDSSSFQSYHVRTGPVSVSKVASDQEGMSFVNFLLTQNTSQKLRLSTAEPNYTFVESGVIIVYFDNETRRFVPTLLTVKDIKCSAPECQVYERM